MESHEAEVKKLRLRVEELKKELGQAEDEVGRELTNHPCFCRNRVGLVLVSSVSELWRTGHVDIKEFFSV